MVQISVIVAVDTPHWQAEGIVRAVRDRSDMSLVGAGVPLAEVSGLLDGLPAPARCAVVLVAGGNASDPMVARWLQQRPDLVVMHQDTDGRTLRLELRDIGLDSLLAALREVIDQRDRVSDDRVVRFRLRPVPVGGTTDTLVLAPSARPALVAAVMWVHAVLRAAVHRLREMTDEGADAGVIGWTTTAAALEQSLDARKPFDIGDVDDAAENASAQLDRALAAADPQHEPLSRLQRQLALSPLELRLFLLAASPELDARYQRCIGVLLDDLGRRVGTLGLFAALLGEPIGGRALLGAASSLARWRAIAAGADTMPPADEPLRVDATLVDWLLGAPDALERDPRIVRCTVASPWPGAELLDPAGERFRAPAVVDELHSTQPPVCVIYAGESPSHWRALIESSAALRHTPLTRVDVARLEGADLVEIDECARRLGRLARLSPRCLVVDAGGPDLAPAALERLGALVTALSGTCRFGVVCTDAMQVLRLLGQEPSKLPTPMLASATLVQGALAALDVTVDATEAARLAARFPLGADGLSLATRLAAAESRDYDETATRRARFIAACQAVASEAVSRLATRIEPVCKLADVVVPPDRREQLDEIVDSVRHASTVLDDWRFGKNLPYGRGVVALFHGPSGTGKTMAAQAIANELDMHLLGLDLSRVVSKYIGETEKHIDTVFDDATRSGAALLIDEADALLGRRSEVKDAHDRYANIEVAFLLQRIESFDGLVMMTTNLRHNLDPAFLRRMRYVVEFPKPDAAARERIWRYCLPEGSHELDDAAFRLLARKVDVTGGHIRQITLRAAFAAAAEPPAGSHRIRREHVERAARAELAKLGLPAVVFDAGEARRVA